MISMIAGAGVGTFVFHVAAGVIAFIIGDALVTWFKKTMAARRAQRSVE